MTRKHQRNREDAAWLIISVWALVIMRDVLPRLHGWPS